MSEVPDDHWTAILERARQHRLLLMMSWRLGSFAKGSIPKSVVSELNEDRRGHSFRQLIIARECVLIHKALNDHDIPHIFLKGVYLASACYPDFDLRPMRDIDILVPKNRAVEAWEMLANFGAQTKETEHLHPDETCTGKHLPAVLSPSKGCFVEIHRVVFGEGPRTEQDAHIDRIWKRQRNTVISGAAIPCMSPEDMRLHLVGHGVYDHNLDLGPLFLTDLKFLIKSQRIDWALVHDEAKLLELTSALYLSLTLAEISVGGPDVKFPKPPSDVLVSCRALLVQDFQQRHNVFAASQTLRSSKPKVFAHFWKSILPSRKKLLTIQTMGGDSMDGQRGYLALWFPYFLKSHNRLGQIIGDGDVRKLAKAQQKMYKWLG
ncbi:MAG: nucleotidyltransferase domain-containing protein [Paracoccaceae bacterium]